MQQVISGAVSNVLYLKMEKMGVLPQMLQNGGKQSLNSYLSFYLQNKLQSDGFGNLVDKVAAIYKRAGGEEKIDERKKVEWIIERISNSADGSKLKSIFPNDVFNSINALQVMYLVSSNKPAYSSYSNFAERIKSIDSNKQFPRIDNNEVFRTLFNLFTSVKPSLIDEAQSLSREYSNEINVLSKLSSTLSPLLANEISSQSGASLSLSDFSLYSQANLIAKGQYQQPIDRQNALEKIEKDITTAVKNCYDASENNRYFFQMLKLTNDAASIGSLERDSDQLRSAIQEIIKTETRTSLSGNKIPNLFSVGMCDSILSLGFISGITILSPDLRSRPTNFETSTFINLIEASLNTQLNKNAFESLADLWRKKFASISIVSSLQNNQEYREKVKDVLGRISGKTLSNFDQGIQSGLALPIDDLSKGYKERLSFNGKGVILNLSFNSKCLNQTKSVETNSMSVDEKGFNKEMLQSGQCELEYSGGHLVNKIQMTKAQETSFVNAANLSLRKYMQEDWFNKAVKLMFDASDKKSDLGNSGDMIGYLSNKIVQIKRQGGDISLIEEADLMKIIFLIRMFEAKYGKDGQISTRINQALEGKTKISVNPSLIEKVDLFLDLIFDDNRKQNEGFMSFFNSFETDYKLVEKATFGMSNKAKNLLFTRKSLTSANQLKLQFQQGPPQFVLSEDEKLVAIQSELLNITGTSTDLKNDLNSQLDKLEAGEFNKRSDKIAVLYLLLELEKVLSAEDKPSKTTDITKVLAKYLNSVETINIKENKFEVVLNTFKTNYKNKTKELTPNEILIKQNVPWFIMSFIGSLSGKVRDSLIEYVDKENQHCENESHSDSKGVELLSKYFQGKEDFSNQIVQEFVNSENIEIVTNRLQISSELGDVLKTLGSLTKNSKIETIMGKTISIIDNLISLSKRKSLDLDAPTIDTAYLILDFIEAEKKLLNLKLPETALTHNKLSEVNFNQPQKVSNEDIQKLFEAINSVRDKCGNKFTWDSLDLYRQIAKAVFFDSKSVSATDPSMPLETFLIKIQEQQLLSPANELPCFKGTTTTLLKAVLASSSTFGGSIERLKLGDLTNNIGKLAISFEKLDMVFSAEKAKNQFGYAAETSQIIKLFSSDANFRTNVREIGSAAGHISGDISSAIDLLSSIEKADTSSFFKGKQPSDQLSYLGMVAAAEKESNPNTAIKDSLTSQGFNVDTQSIGKIVETFNSIKVQKSSSESNIEHHYQQLDSTEKYNLANKNTETVYQSTTPFVFTGEKRPDLAQAMSKAINGDIPPLLNVIGIRFKQTEEKNLEDVIEEALFEIKKIESSVESSNQKSPQFVKIVKLISIVVVNLAEKNKVTNPIVILRLLSILAKLTAKLLFNKENFLIMDDVRTIINAANKLYFLSGAQINELQLSLYKNLTSINNEIVRQDVMLEVILLTSISIFDLENEITCGALQHSMITNIPRNNLVLSKNNETAKQIAFSNCTDGHLYHIVEKFNFLYNREIDIRERKNTFIGGLMMFYGDYFAAINDLQPANLVPTDFLYNWYANGLQKDYLLFEESILTVTYKNITFSNALNTCIALYLKNIKFIPQLSLVPFNDFLLTLTMIDKSLSNDSTSILDLISKIEGAGFVFNYKITDALLKIYKKVKKGKTQNKAGVEDYVLYVKRFVNKSFIGSLSERNEINGKNIDKLMKINKIGKEIFLDLVLKPLNLYFVEMSSLFRYAKDPYLNFSSLGGVSSIKELFNRNKEISAKDQFIVISLMIMSSSEELKQGQYIEGIAFSAKLNEQIKNSLGQEFQFSSSKLTSFANETSKICTPELFKLKLSLSLLNVNNFAKMFDKLSVKAREYLSSEVTTPVSCLKKSLSMTNYGLSARLMEGDKVFPKVNQSIFEETSLSTLLASSFSSVKSSSSKSSEQQNSNFSSQLNNQNNKSNQIESSDNSGWFSPFNKIKTGIQNTADKIENGIQKAADKVENGIQNATNKIENGIQNAADKIETSIDNVQESAKRSVEIAKLKANDLKEKTKLAFDDSPVVKSEEERRLDIFKRWRLLEKEEKYNLDPVNKCENNVLASLKNSNMPWIEKDKVVPITDLNNVFFGNSIYKEDFSKLPTSKTATNIENKNDIVKSSEFLNKSDQTLTENSINGRLAERTSDFPNGTSLNSEDVSLDIINQQNWDTTRFEKDTKGNQKGPFDFGEMCGKKEISVGEQQKMLLVAFKTSLEKSSKRKKLLTENQYKRLISTEFTSKLKNNGKIEAKAFELFSKIVQYSVEKANDASTAKSYKYIFDSVLFDLMNLSETPFTKDTFVLALGTALKLAAKSGMSTWKMNRKLHFELYKKYLTLYPKTDKPIGNTFEELIKSIKEKEIPEKIMYNYFFGQKKEARSVPKIFVLTSSVADFVTSVKDPKTQNLESIFYTSQSNPLALPIIDQTRELTTVFVKIFIQDSFVKGNKALKGKKNEDYDISDLRHLSKEDINSYLIALWRLTFISQVDLVESNNRLHLDMLFNDYVSASVSHVTQLNGEKSDLKDIQVLVSKLNLEKTKIKSPSDAFIFLEFVLQLKEFQERDEAKLANPTDKWLVGFMNAINIPVEDNSVQPFFDLFYSYYGKQNDGCIKKKHENTLRWPISSEFDKLPDHLRSRGEYILSIRLLFLRMLDNLTKEGRKVLGLEEGLLFSLKKEDDFYAPNYVERIGDI